jgi:hypothetical protein
VSETERLLGPERRSVRSNLVRLGRPAKRQRAVLEENRYRTGQAVDAGFTVRF